MKNILPILLGAALLPLAAQATSTSNVVGYETLDLTANVFNPVGIRLHSPTVVSSTFTALTGVVATDTAVDFDATLTAGTTYILEVTSGALDGAVQEITTWGTASGNTANDIVTPQDLSSLGAVVGDKYSVRAAPTLESIFGTTDSVLQKGFNALSADVVWIPDGALGYERYFLSTLNVWKTASGVNAPNTAVVYTDGLLIEKKGAAASVVVSGEVKTGNTMVVVLTGFNPIGTVYPAGATLQNSGLSDDLKPGFNALVADNVWIPNGTGGYDRYFYSTLNVWKTAAGANAPADLPLPSAVLIERKDAAKNLHLTPPLSYASL
jgi:hypothetical protein